MLYSESMKKLVSQIIVSTSIMLLWSVTSHAQIQMGVEVESEGFGVTDFVKELDEDKL